MLSDRLWRRRYGADPAVVGRRIQLDGVAHTVVGILPADFRLALPSEAFLLTDAEIWAPLQFDYSTGAAAKLHVLYRLRPAPARCVLRPGARGDEPIAYSSGRSSPSTRPQLRIRAVRSSTTS